MTAFRILVVEDNFMMRSLYQRVMQLITEDVVITPNGADALAHMEQTHFHLIITDLNLPGLSGLDLLHHARNTLKLNNTKIVAVTANRSAMNAPEIAYADEVLEKPVTNYELLSTCEKLLNTFRVPQMV